MTDWNALLFSHEAEKTGGLAAKTYRRAVKTRSSASSASGFGFGRIGGFRCMLLTEYRLIRSKMRPRELGIKMSIY
jgi:hypothetical protein